MQIFLLLLAQQVGYSGGVNFASILGDPHVRGERRVPREDARVLRLLPSSTRSAVAHIAVHDDDDGTRIYASDRHSRGKKKQRRRLAESNDRKDPWLMAGLQLFAFISCGTFAAAVFIGRWRCAGKTSSVPTTSTAVMIEV